MHFAPFHGMCCDLCAQCPSELTPTRIPLSVCSTSYVTVTLSSPTRLVIAVVSVKVPLMLPLNADPEDCTPIPYGREQGRGELVSSTGILKMPIDISIEQSITRQSSDMLHWPETAW